jgi:hypothetical protein
MDIPRGPADARIFEHPLRYHRGGLSGLGVLPDDQAAVVHETLARLERLLVVVQCARELLWAISGHKLWRDLNTDHGRHLGD